MLCPLCRFDSPVGVHTCPACGTDLDTVTLPNPAPVAIPDPPAAVTEVPTAEVAGLPQSAPPAPTPGQQRTPPVPAPSYPPVPAPGYPAAPAPAYQPPPVAGPGYQQATGGYPALGGQPYPGAPGGGYPHAAPTSPGYQYPTGGYPRMPVPQSGGYPYPAGPGVPTGPLEPPPRRTLLVVLICLGVVAILGLGAVAVLHLVDKPAQTGSDGNNTSTGSNGNSNGVTGAGTAGSTAGNSDARARAEATSLDQLLSSAMNSRVQLKAGLDEANACGDLNDALGKINAVVSDRKSQLQQAGQIDLGAFSNADSLHQTLGQAWDLSLQADQAYGRWVQWMINNGCGSNGDKDDGDTYSNQSHAAKDQFIAVWNPIAQRFGLPTRAETDV